MLAFGGGTQDVHLAAVAMDHRAERRPPHLTSLGGDARAVAERDRDHLALHGERRPVELKVIRQRRVYVERVDLIEIGCIVRRRPSEVTVETANDAERPADAKVAVEIHHPGNGDVRLVIPGGPRQMRVAQENRATRPGAGGGERPRVRSLLDGIGRLVGGWSDVAGLPSPALARWRLKPREEPPCLAR